MGRPRYQITDEDQLAAAGWIGRHLDELPTEAAQALKKAFSPEDLQNIVDRFFNSAQRRRLHTSIRQTRHRARQESVCVTLNGETAAQLYWLDRWREEETRKLYQLASEKRKLYQLDNETRSPKKSINDLLKKIIFERWHEKFWARIRAREGQEGKQFFYDYKITAALDPDTLDLKAGQKLDK